MSWVERHSLALGYGRRDDSCSFEDEVFVNMDEFRISIDNDESPTTLGAALAGLWWDAKGDWNKAHESAQQDEGPQGAWVHAYLHRKEGDSANAAYWYRRAGKAVFSGSLTDEWSQIVSELLA